MIYNKYIKYMLSEGWKLNRRIFTEKDLNVKTFSCEKENTKHVIIIKNIPKCIMSLCGSDDILEDDNITKTHKLKLRLCDKDNAEISQDTKIRITKERTGRNSGINHYARIKYSDIRTEYEFKYGMELRGLDKYNDFIYIYVISPDLDIDKDKTELSIEMDIWSKGE